MPKWFASYLLTVGVELRADIKVRVSVGKRQCFAAATEKKSRKSRATASSAATADTGVLSLPLPPPPPIVRNPWDRLTAKIHAWCTYQQNIDNIIGGSVPKRNNAYVVRELNLTLQRLGITRPELVTHWRVSAYYFQALARDAARTAAPTTPTASGDGVINSALFAQMLVANVPEEAREWMRYATDTDFTMVNNSRVSQYINCQLPEQNALQLGRHLRAYLRYLRTFCDTPTALDKKRVAGRFKQLSAVQKKRQNKRMLRLRVRRKPRTIIKPGAKEALFVFLTTASVAVVPAVDDESQPVFNACNGKLLLGEQEFKQVEAELVEEKISAIIKRKGGNDKWLLKSLSVSAEVPFTVDSIRNFYQNHRLDFPSTIVRKSGHRFIGQIIKTARLHRAKRAPTKKNKRVSDNIFLLPDKL